MKPKFFARAAVIALVALFSGACNVGEDAYGYNEPTIYSDSSSNLFSEVVFFLKPYVYEGNRKRYVVVDRLENVHLIIHEKIEKRTDSYPFDALHLDGQERCGDYQVVDQVLSYPVVVGVSMLPHALTTAGEYADLLNDYLNLKPGVYVCRIVSFDLATVDGERRTIYTPTLSFPLEVAADRASVLLGAFEVEIK
jgi:hypothetical protein